MAEIMELADRDLKTVNINMFKNLKEQLANFNPWSRISPAPVSKNTGMCIHLCIVSG